MEKSELAREYFLKGYNCAQSVALAFTEELGMDEATVARMVCGFGGGMSRMREVCGAVSGGVFVLSALRGYDRPTSDRSKTDCYALVQEYMKRFRAENGSYICRTLLGLAEGEEDPPEASARTPQYYAERPCARLCECGARMVSELLRETQED